MHWVDNPPFMPPEGEPLEKNPRLLIVIGAVLIAASSAYWFMLPGETDGEYGDVTVERAMELIKEKPPLVILDVRTDGEFRDGHIEGCLLYTSPSPRDRS